MYAAGSPRPAHIQGMTTQFTEADHPRGPGGKFATKPHAEQSDTLTSAVDPRALEHRLMVCWEDWTDLTDDDLDTMIDYPYGPSNGPADYDGDEVTDSLPDDLATVMRIWGPDHSTEGNGLYAATDEYDSLMSRASQVWMVYETMNGDRHARSHTRDDMIDAAGVSGRAATGREAARAGLRLLIEDAIHLDRTVSARRRMAFLNAARTRTTTHLYNDTPGVKSLACAVYPGVKDLSNYPRRARTMDQHQQWFVEDEQAKREMGRQKWISRRVNAVERMPSRTPETMEMVFPNVVPHIVEREMAGWDEKSPEQKHATIDRLTRVDEDTFF